MIYASRGAPPVVKSLEVEGIRYQQVEDGFDLNLPARCGYLQALDLKTGESLWVTQIYVLGHNPDIEDDVQESYFLRMKYHPEKREILIENERRGKYFMHIDTQKVRDASPTDFPPPVKRPPPPEIAPIEYRGLRYEQVMNAHDYGKPARCGYMKAVAIKTNIRQRSYLIYDVPFNDEIEDDQQECYFTRMILLPGEQDILIENEAGGKYLFNLKRQEVRPFEGEEGDYQPEKIGLFERLKDAWREWLRRWKR